MKKPPEAKDTHPKQTQIFHCYILKLSFVSTCSFIRTESEQLLLVLLCEHTGTRKRRLHNPSAAAHTIARVTLSFAENDQVAQVLNNAALSNDCFMQITG